MVGVRNRATKCGYNAFGDLIAISMRGDGGGWVVVEGLDGLVGSTGGEDTGNGEKGDTHGDYRRQELMMNYPF